VIIGLTLAAACGPTATWSPPVGASVRDQSSTPVQSGYGANENFCAQPPLKGTVRYLVTSDRASLGVDLRGLPPRSLIGVDWANNTVRGYLVGTLASDARGASRAGSAKLYRTGEVRAYKLVLTWPDDNHAVGTLWPCGPPPLTRPAIAVDPKVSVSPSSGLARGETVSVEATGFGKDQKVFLSECDTAEDASDLGCGDQLAAQPFLSTGAKRSGSTHFTLRASAATMPDDTRPPAACTRLCVIVATQGDGFAWAVAPLTFRELRHR
jgi:Neocarzinostatin family